MLEPSLIALSVLCECTETMSVASHSAVLLLETVLIHQSQLGGPVTTLNAHLSPMHVRRLSRLCFISFRPLYL